MRVIDFTQPTEEVFMKVSKVKRSYERFRDYASDFINSDSDTFDDRLAMLINFFEHDEVLSVIHHQLLQFKGSKFDSWLADRKSTAVGMMGSGDLKFPKDIDERLALMYQLLYRINEGEVDVLNFSHDFFSSGSNITYTLQNFNRAISVPLFREIDYKFQDLMDDLPDNEKQDVNPAIIQFIGNAQNVIQQNVTGNNNNLSANQAVSSLDEKLDELRDEILSQVKGPEAKDYLETIDSAHQLLKNNPPMKKPAELLLNSLPHVGNVFSIVASILTMVSV